MNQYFVYIMSNYRGTLYVGVTNDLARRVHQHRSGYRSGFTKKYHVTKLVNYEATSEVSSVIAREKQIKGWVRRKKVELIESTNPGWTDIAEHGPIASHPLQTLRSTQGDMRQTQGIG